MHVYLRALVACFGDAHLYLPLLTHTVTRKTCSAALLIMGDIPSDFDYSLLLSDNPPLSDFADFTNEDSLPTLPPDSFLDDIEAINKVTEERKEILNKKGVVIQHRLWDNKAVFRSSSLPPGAWWLLIYFGGKCGRVEWLPERVFSCCC